LPKLAAPETHPKLAHVVGGTVTQTEQTVNRLIILLRERRNQVSEIGDFVFGAVGSFTDDSTPFAAQL
jgi:hypothetical protein